MNEPPQQTRLELKLGAPEVALKHLVSAASTFAALINEVARSYLGTQREPVRWIVEVRPGSVRLPVRPQALTEDVRPSKFPELVTLIVDGLAKIDARPERPAYFSDKALEQAKALGNLSSDALPISVLNGNGRADLTKRASANVDDILGRTVTSYGTVEGTLEAVNIHGPSPTFSVYDALTGRALVCRLTDRVSVDNLRPAIDKRVGVRGPIQSRGGQRVGIEAHELMIFPSDDDLPSPADVRGILKA